MPRSAQGAQSPGSLAADLAAPAADNVAAKGAGHGNGKADCGRSADGLVDINAAKAHEGHGKRAAANADKSWKPCR